MRHVYLLLWSALISIALPVHVNAALPADDVVRAEPEGNGWRHVEAGSHVIPTAVATGDTIYFGGSGLGDGSVVRGGVWDFESDSGETPEFFLDGDPVGNQFRDGFTFDDKTTHTGPSQVGAGHWRPDGTYDFDDDTGSYAHRATFHANDGVNDGPDPLDDPDHPGGAWSVWIGTNLYLNPEHCGWQESAGYGNFWSQGIQKQYTINSPVGTPLSLEFYHRYATEVNWDTNWVETSYDGVFWSPVGSDANPEGIYQSGDKQNPLPTADGGFETVQLGPWPGGDVLWVRFRLRSDWGTSDESESGTFLFSWQLDNISLVAGSTPVDFTDFEQDLGGWEPMRFEGYEFDITLEHDRPSGRIVSMAELGCQPVLNCPESCGLDGNILIFVDKDDCDMHDVLQESRVNSPPFSIGGAANPDIANWSGRLMIFDVYFDGGSGLFSNYIRAEVLYSPYGQWHCPYSPPSGDPGAGDTFDWTRSHGVTTANSTYGQGASCRNNVIKDCSAVIPTGTDSIIVRLGARLYCRGWGADCDQQDAGTPFYDNVRFGVYNTEGLAINRNPANRYADSFPLAGEAHQGLAPETARSDVQGNSAGTEFPKRFVRSDSATIAVGAPDVTVHLRWKTVPGPCQDLSNPFFAAFPPHTWCEARMDLANITSYMTCYHADDPHDGTSWGGEATPTEPCDDILPDGVFSPGTRVFYFFEVRDESSGDVLATSPNGRNYTSIDTTANFAYIWDQYAILPELLPPGQGGCDPGNVADRANNLLVVEVPFWSLPHKRMLAILDSFELDYDWYQVGANYGGARYNGIGRREDRIGQPPRPPVNGANQAQLEPYDCIWYFTGGLDIWTMSDRTTLEVLGGQPSEDQQKLENWLIGCSTGEERLLIIDGYSWASDVDNNTTHGHDFLEFLGVEVLAQDYTLHAGDSRRCARIAGDGLIAPDFRGQIYGTGCPDNFQADVLTSISSGETVASFVNSHEGGNDPIDCADDVNMPGWAAVIRNAAGPNQCRRSVAMGIGYARLQELDCNDECMFTDWRLGGDAASPAQLLSDLFAWANKPIGPPIGVADAGGSPAPSTRLVGARPNPANPQAVIRYALGANGPVRLKVFDVNGRLVRTLVEEIQESAAEPYEVIWDGRDDEGRRMASGVFFYQLEAPGYSSAKKLVLLK